MSDVPEVVRKQAEEAEKKWQEAYGKPEEPAPENAPEEAEAPLSEPELTAEAPEKVVDWEHKFRVIEGKYRAEVPRLHQENRAIREELEALRREIQKPVEPKEAEAPDFKLLDDYFDKDARKQLDAYIEQKVQARLKDVQTTVQQTRQVAAQTAEQAFWKDVMKTVPDYQAVSADPEFGDWLAQPMPMTPYTRYQLMMDAYQAGSADRFAEFITSWRGGKEVPVTKDAVDPALKKKAIPPKAAGGSVPGDGKKVYSREEYAQLGEKARKAQMQGRREEAKKHLAEMDAVLSDGRLRAA